jgi:hypothetical protein
MKKNQRFFRKPALSTRWWQIFLIMALAVPLSIFPLSATAAKKNKDTIAKVEAEGKVQAKPDKATLHFTVVTEAPQAQAAAQANAKEAENFLAAVKKALGEQDRVQTLDYRVLPIFRKKETVQGKEKIRTDEIAGYRAAHRFKVELRDLQKIGQVSDIALKNGANQVQGPFFSHTQQEDLQRQAAVKALKRARKLADALAQAAGLKVKRVKKISTTHDIHPRKFGLARAAAPPGGKDIETPIEVGEITFRASLTVTYELAP